MQGHYLNSLFSPRSIALFGASETKDSLGAVVYHNLLTSGFKGAIYAINPKHEEVQGRTAYKGLDEIDEVVDLAVVATPAKTVPDIVESCGLHGVKAMIILSAGFREIGREGKALEDRVGEIAARYGIRFLGPNCLGLIRTDIGLNATFGNNKALPGNLALVSQSGALCTAVLDWAEQNNIGFSVVVSTGISSDIDFGDILDYLVSDPKTHSILLYIEGINDARLFMSGLRAAARIKPVIALKVGRHPVGVEASMSHTGALIGSDEAFTAALARSGVLRVDTIGQLFSAARALSSRYPGSGDRLVIITNGGGPGVMAADRAADLGLNMVTLSDETLKALDEVLPSVWSHANPVDVIGDASPERYRQAVDICLQDRGVDGVIVILTPQAMTYPTEVAEAIIDLAKTHTKPVLSAWMGGEQVMEGRKAFQRAGIPCFATVEAAVEAFSYLAAYKTNQQLLLQTPAKSIRGQHLPDVEGGRLIIQSVLAEGHKLLNETESFALLAAFGITSVRSGVARSPHEALILAESIGFPLVMKILSPDITHKTDAGGIRLNINSARMVRSIYQELIEQVKHNRPEARIEGVTIEQMYRSPHGRELMIGVISDPVFGPILSFGSGGTSVEIIKDTAVSLPPLNRRLAMELIQRTRVSKALGRFRNMSAANLDALLEVLLKVSTMACELPELKEMDINPLILDDKGALVVDARFRVDFPKHSADPYHHMAIHPYPGNLESHCQLSDGTDIVIRPIRPEDAEIEQNFIRSLSEEARYFRFMRSLHELTSEMLVRFTQIDYDREMALIAVTKREHDEEEIAVGRYVTNLDRRSCEFALVVSDKWQRQGIGHRLMTSLMEVARERGLDTMEGEVLSNNVKMLELMRSLGFSVQSVPGDPSIKRVEHRL